MRTTTGWFFSLALLLMGCAANDSARLRAPASEAADGFAAEESPATNPLAGAFFDDGGDGSIRGRSESAFAPAGASAGVAKAAKDRMLIQTGQVAVEVSRPDEVMESFRTQVIAWGGHLHNQSDYTLTVRVPASRFDEAFDWVKHSGRVIRESRRAQDVTEEFLDLGIRIETARRSRERLLEILQKADKVEDILKVEAELRRLTEEIERMEGRKKFLADQVALATLTATFQPLAEPPPVKRRRQASRFDWINRIGAERMMEDFR